MIRMPHFPQVERRVSSALGKTPLALLFEDILKRNRAPKTESAELSARPTGTDPGQEQLREMLEEEKKVEGNCGSEKRKEEGTEIKKEVVGRQDEKAAKGAQENEAQELKKENEEQQHKRFEGPPKKSRRLSSVGIVA